MEEGTDRLGLSNEDVFKIISSNIVDVSVKTKHLIECKDNILFVWNAIDVCLFALNLKTLGEKSSDLKRYQTLMPTDPPYHEVDSVKVNTTTTQVALAGTHGVLVLDLPRRWGKGGGFQGGKQSLLCKSSPVDKHYFSCHPHVELRQCRWHPGSGTDSHLVLLSSENVLRLYQTGPEDVQLIRQWSLGRHPAPLIPERIPLLVGLGETAVDFDFCPPVLLTPDEKKDISAKLHDNCDVVWPVLILRGNGDVYMLTMSLSEGVRTSTVHSPLPMYPPADDNYGVDACSLLCLQTEPPVVVIATCSGTLYHSILLSCGQGDEDSWSQFGSTYSLNSPDAALYVTETVELELGLSLDDSDTYTCPVHLHHDPSDTSRYFCSHETGVHIVSLPIVTELVRYLMDDEDALPVCRPAAVEYAVCTRSGGSPVAPIMGLSLSTSPPVHLIVLLATGEVVSLALASTALPAPTADWAEDTETPPSALQSLLKEPFDVHIQNILKHVLSQPILKLAPYSNPTPQECMELVSRTTQLFREEYFQRHDRAKEEIEGRVRTLRNLKMQQLQELQNMELEKVALQQSAEQLAEKYEDIKDKQEELTKRAENLLRLINLKQPVISVAERKLSKELQSVEEKVKEFRRAIEHVKAKQNYHKAQINQWTSHQKTKELYLRDNQQETIQSNLKKVTTTISDLIGIIEDLKKELGL